MATAVQIELMVDGQGAVQGVRAFDTSIKSTTNSVHLLNNELGKVKPPSGINQIEKDFTAGEGSIRTMNAEVRSLQGSLFGDTRAASEFLASINGVGAAMELAFPVFGAVALAGVLVQAGEKAHELYEKYLDVNGAAKEYGKEIAKSREQDFGNVRSIETARDRIEEATDNLRMYQSLSKQFESQANLGFTPWSAVEGYENHRSAKENADKSTAAQQQLDKLKQDAMPELQHQAILDAIELSHADEARLTPLQKATDEKLKQHAIDEESQKYTAAMENRLNFGDPDAGKDIEKTENAIADKKAAAEIYNLQRDQTHELMQIRNEATNAALRGSALYAAQESQAIEELKFKDMDSAAARNAIHEKFHNEEMRRLQDEQQQVAKRSREADTAGLTGIAKIQAQGANRDKDILADKNYFSLDDKQQDRVSNQRQTLAEMRLAEQSFSQDVSSLADQSATHQISGFARIRAEGEKQLDAYQRKFNEVYGGIDRTAPGGEAAYQQGVSQLNRAKSYINAGTADQTAELAQKNAQETAQIEEEARSKSLSAEKQKTAAIEAEYQQRLEKYQQALQQQEISQDDYNRRVAAAAEERDAEMVQSAQEARAKMAGEFSSLFESLNHPLQGLQKMGEKAAGEAAAAMVQHFQMGDKGLPQQVTRQSGFGGMFGDFLNMGGRGRKGSQGIGADRYNLAAATTSPVAPTAPDLAAAAPHAPSLDRIAEMPTHAAATSSVFSIGTATIRVGSAQISFGGSTGGRGGSGAPGIGSSSGSGMTGSAAMQDAVLEMDRTSGGGTTSASRSAPTSRDAVVSMYGSGGGNGSSGGGFGGGSSDSSIAFGGGGGTVGGSGSAGTPQAPASTGAGETAPPRGAGMTGAISDLNKSVGLGQQAMSIFGSKSSSTSGLQTTSPALTELIPNADGSDNTTASTSSSGGMVGGGGIKSNLGGAVNGAMGLYGAYSGNGGVGGALGGAMSGMQLGMAVGGPVGAAIGAAGGAIIGAIGPGGREKARVYDLKTVRPRITADQDSYNEGGMDYLSAYSDMQSADMAAKTATNAMGPAAQSYYQDTIKKELQTAEANFSREQKAGRSMYTSSAPQYATGIDSVPQTQMALVHQGERIFNTDQNKQITDAFNVHKSYVSSMQRGGASSGSRTSGDTHLHFHAHDSKSAMQFLMSNRHVIRSAVNASYAENSGGSDA